jgi:hypothetical protein
MLDPGSMKAESFLLPFSIGVKFSFFARRCHQLPELYRKFMRTLYGPPYFMLPTNQRQNFMKDDAFISVPKSN